jgi:methyl-accepting chemotaxis protein
MLIRTKASLVQAAMTAVALTALVAIVYVSASGIVNKKDDASYGEKLEGVLKVVDAEYQALAKTGLADTQDYVEKTQKELLANLTAAYYGKKTPGVTLFILDAAGKVVMHPTLAPGAGDLAAADVAKRITALAEGGAITVALDGNKTWVVSRHYKPWNWYVAFAVTEKVKYAEVTGFLRLVVLVSVVAMAAILAVTYVLMKRFLAPLSRIVETAESLNRGNLDVEIEVKSEDEVGRSLLGMKAMVERLRAILGAVRASAAEVASASETLSRSTTAMSEGVTAQAASLEETAATFEELTATVKQNAERAKEATRCAQNAREIADTGGSVVERAIAATQAISGASKEIAAISGTIDDIAFQTNLLALNAAVEAARAGEQGRGFAVVASEVRALAQRSAAAAKEIKTLITDSAAKVDDGVTLVSKTGETLVSIVKAVKTTSELIADISAASEQQAIGIDQVSRTVAQIETITNKTAEQARDVSGTGDSLAGQAEKLSALATARLDAAESRAQAPRPAPTPARGVPGVRRAVPEVDESELAVPAGR